MSYPEDHPVLDLISRALKQAPSDVVREVSRESECVEFTDSMHGRRFEVVVRAIDDEPKEEDEP
jgi:hypothetical protein